MPANVQVHRYTGATPVGQDVTNLNTRFVSTDQVSQNTVAYPIQVPLVGYNYSYWVHTRLVIADANPTTTINNIKWYLDAVNGLGYDVTIMVAKASAGVDAGYRQATGVEGAYGVEMNQQNHTGLDMAPVDGFTYTFLSPLQLNGSSNLQGPFGDYLVMQLRIGPNAQSGLTPEELVTWRFDET